MDTDTKLDNLISAVEYFKLLNDETRLRCLLLLYQEGTLCVCELTAALALSQPKISRHLAQLRQARLLIDSRVGQWVYYQLNPQLPAWTLDILAVTTAAVLHTPPYQHDLKRLHCLAQRPQKPCE